MRVPFRYVTFSLLLHFICSSGRRIRRRTQGLCSGASESECQSAALSSACCFDGSTGSCLERAVSNGCGLRNDEPKCALLTRRACNEMTGSCVWYGAGGCRKPCNFRDLSSCGAFEACSWNEQTASCQEVPGTGGGVDTEFVLQLTHTAADVNTLEVSTVLPALREAFTTFRVQGARDLRAEITVCNSTASRESLCRRFMEFVDKNQYKRVAEAAHDWTLAVQLSGAKVVSLEDIRAVSSSLKTSLGSRDAVMEDIHFNRQAAVPNVVIMMADDLGWGDVGFQACEISEFSESKSERICSPKELTPNLDAMAEGENSLVFNRFYTTPICGPSRSSILTGREPIRECMLRNVYRSYDPPELTPPAGLTCTLSIAEMARHAGLRTFHAGKWHVGKLHKVTGDGDLSPSEPDDVVSSPGDNGYDEWYATPRQGPTYRFNCGCFPSQVECHMGIYNSSFFWEHYAEKGGSERKYMSQNNRKLFTCENYWYKSPTEDRSTFDKDLPGNGGWPTPIMEDDSKFIVDRFETFLDRDLSKPFFATLWFHSPHGPYVADPSYVQAARALVDSIPNPTECGEVFDDKCNDIESSSTCKALCRDIRMHFYASILAMDEQVGRVRQLLAERGLTENTMVVFLSDNGPARFDASSQKNPRYIGPGSASHLLEWKFSYNEGGIRVPAIVEFPELIKSNRKTNYVASSYDFLPTAMELFNYVYTVEDLVLDGVSWVPHMIGVKEERHKPVVIVNAQRDIHFIKQTVSVADDTDKSRYVYYAFDEERDKMRVIDEDDELENHFKRWNNYVFADSVCKDSNYDGGDIKGISVEQCISSDYIIARDEQLV